MGILEDLERVLVNDIASDLGRKSLGAEEDLLSQGIIDSLGLMKLIAFIESNFRVKVGDDEIIPENFQSLDSMVRLIEKKRLPG
jgi:acyl carrier protein